MTRENDTSQDGWEDPRQGESYKARPRPRPRSPQGNTGGRPNPRPRSGQGNTNDPRGASRNPYPPYQRPSQDAYEDSSEPPRQRPPSQRRPASPRDRDEEYQVTDPPIQRRRQTRDFREEDNTEYQQQQPPQRPRTTRQSREDAYARLRQRPSTGGRDTSRSYIARDDPDEPPVRTPPRRVTNPEVEEYDRAVRRPGPRPIPATPRRARPTQQRHRSWPALLIGCIGGIITVALIASIAVYLLIHNVAGNILPGLGNSGSTFSDKQQSIPLSIPATITQLQINNSAGNISITVDTNNTGASATLTYTKKVQASSSSNATTEFGRISVNTGNGNTASCPQTSCLLVNAIAPDTTRDSVDMALVLPFSVIRLPSDVNATPPFMLSANTAVKGDITVTNFDGILSLKAPTQGNISMQHGLVFAGSCLFTNSGNITFNGALNIRYSSAVVPCSNTSTTNTHAWYRFHTEQGNADVTLPAATNVILDASTNTGKINSDFTLIPPASLINYCGTSPPSSTYFCGPLIAGSTVPSAILKLDVSTGNITIHKAPGS